MKYRATILVLILLPILVGCGFALTKRPMNAPVIAVLGAVMIWLGYTGYARRIDQTVIQPDAKKATPARMYMDGVDFMPTSRNVLYGYHFKSIAAAGPIVGPIAAVALWGWLPSLLWLTLGVTFLGWASDYSAIMVAVRNDGNSLSAIAHRLIAPRARVILFVFIFFYLLLLAGAFVGIMAGIFDPRADVPFGIVVSGHHGPADGADALSLEDGPDCRHRARGRLDDGRNGVGCARNDHREGHHTGRASRLQPWSLPVRSIPWWRS